MITTKEEVRELFEYRDGHLYRRKNTRSRNGRAGDRIGFQNQQGYWRTKIGTKNYAIHRLIYLYHHGVLPTEVDHIDRDPSNNRIENLRECTRQENNRNTVSRDGSKSRYKGVTPLSNGKWKAQAKVNGKQNYLGLFPTELEAAKAYDDFIVDIHKDFVKLNVDN